MRLIVMRLLALVVLLGSDTPAVARARPPAAPARAPLQQDARLRAAGEAPAIGLTAALALADRYLAAHHIDLSRSYLQGAVFDTSLRRWVLDWQEPRAKGGVGVLYLSEAGDVEFYPGE